MIRINLIKSNTLEKESFFSKIPLKNLVVKILLLTLATISLAYYENYQLSVLKEEWQNLENKRKGIKEKIKIKSESIKSQHKISDKTALSQKIDQEKLRKASLMNLARKRMQPVQILDRLQNVIPDNLWITSLNYDPLSSESDLMMKVIINGKGSSMEEVSSFIKSLETEEKFENLNLEESRSSFNRAQRVEQIFVTFRLTGEIRIGI